MGIGSPDIEPNPSVVKALSIAMSHPRAHISKLSRATNLEKQYLVFTRNIMMLTLILTLRCFL